MISQGKGNSFKINRVEKRFKSGLQSNHNRVFYRQVYANAKITKIKKF